MPYRYPIPHRWILVLAVLVLWTPLASAEGPDVRPFESGSLETIRSAREGKPFLLHLWSLECRPCLEELESLAQLHRQHPELDMVLVAVDGPAYREQVRLMLQRHGLEDVEIWNFAQPQGERLRYEIDPRWFGELPRNYLYDAAHERVGISGKLRPEQLEGWLEGVRG